MFLNNSYTNKCFFFSFLIIVTTQICAVSLSGLFSDNGLGKTIMQRSISPEEKQELEMEMLKLLGLPKRPKILHKNQIQKSAPNFLLNIYKSISKENAGDRFPRSASELSLSNEDLDAIDQSEVIITFQSQDERISGVRRKNNGVLWFSVSKTITEEDGLIRADLRLYKTACHNTRNVTGTGDGTERTYTIKVYQIYRNQSGEERKFVTGLDTTSNFDGWIEFNITSVLVSWITNRNNNQGLYLSVEDIDSPDTEITLDDIGIINTHGADDKQPFMAGFFKANPLNVQNYPVSKKSRSFRDTSRRHRKYPLIDDIYSSKSSFNCQLKNLYVSFKDLEWKDWIIAPEGYEAFYCAGECSFPFTSDITNHAIVQMLVHLMKPHEIPKPCCAPKKLGSTSVLYALESSSAILKKYKNMVVKECACQ